MQINVFWCVCEVTCTVDTGILWILTGPRGIAFRAFIHRKGTFQSDGSSWASLHWSDSPVAQWCGGSLWPGNVEEASAGAVNSTKLQQSNQGVKPGLIWYPGAVLITAHRHSETHTHMHARARVHTRTQGKNLFSVLHSGIALIVLELQVLYWFLLIIFKWTIMAVSPVVAHSYPTIALVHFSD